MIDIETYPECLCRGDASGHVQTRTAETEQSYRDRYDGMARSWCRKHGEWLLSPTELVAEVVIDLDRRSATYRKASLKLYHAAIRQHLRDLWNEDAIGLKQIERLDALMRDQKPAPDRNMGRRGGGKTSADRAKSVKPETLAALVAVLLDSPTPIRRIAAAQLEHGVTLATRPFEFLAMREVEPDVFRVPSAKYSESNHRGLEPFRILPTDDYSPAELDELRDVIDLIEDELARGATLPGIQRRCQRAIRQARAMLNGKQKAAAYTARHQARANMAAMGMTSEEVAVVMGHASAGTAQSHYAPARRAWRGMAGIRPPEVDPGLVAKVRPDTRNRPWIGGRAEVFHGPKI